MRLFVLALASCNLLLQHQQGVKVDAGSDVALEAAPDPFSPLAVPDVFVWLDGDEVVLDGEKVSSWHDKTDRGNDAFARPDVAKKIAMPTYVPGAKNGHGGVKFACDSYMDIADVADTRFGKNDYTLVFVVSYHNVPPYISEYGGYGELWVKPWAGGWPHYGVGVGANAPADVATPDGGPREANVFYTAIKSAADGNDGVVFTSGNGYNDDKVHIVIADRRGATSLGIVVDGQSMRNDGIVAVNIDSPDIPVDIGGRANVFGADGVTQCLRGILFEIIGVHRSVRDDEVHTLNDYFKNKYALSF